MLVGLSNAFFEIFEALLGAQQLIGLHDTVSMMYIRLLQHSRRSQQHLLTLDEISISKILICRRRMARMLSEHCTEIQNHTIAMHLLKKLLLVCCKVDVLLTHGLPRALAYSLNLLQFIQQPARAVRCTHLRMLAAVVAGGEQRKVGI